VQLAKTFSKQPEYQTNSFSFLSSQQQYNRDEQQEKVFVAGRVSGNEQLGATAEKREVNARGLLLHMLCCGGVQLRLLAAICIHLA